MFPSLFPIFDLKEKKLFDGLSVSLCSFCKKAISEKRECLEFYASLEKRPPGYHQCPFGFTTRNFIFGDRMRVITGIIGFPRFDTDSERRMAKQFASQRISREAVEAFIRFLLEAEELRADAILEASKVLPQAFHELRKLNGAILQHAEREITEHGETRGLVSIRSAAELMRNNFDILEALSNIEGMKALPSDATINLFDLAYKMKRVLHEKAAGKGININLTGVRAIIRGSQKSFPIVPAVLLENAIKYGIPGRPIHVDVSGRQNKAVLVVENEAQGRIDPERCFDKGSRFSTEVEGGGFGLYLAREIVGCHSGTIRCEVDNGTVRMTVSLPLVKTVPGP